MFVDLVFTNSLKANILLANFVACLSVTAVSMLIAGEIPKRKQGKQYFHIG